MKRIFQDRNYSCIVKLLDGDEFKTELTKSTRGRELLERVCKHVGLEEDDFFGLKFICSKDRQLSWLDNAKTLGKQLGAGPYQLVFRVKFYPSHPSTVQEDITRYQLVLQVREDLLKERLVCSVPIHALLASYLIQAEKGDFDPIDHRSDYLDGLQFMPNQKEDFLERVKDFHRKHKGLTPADAEFHYLDNARKIPLFGMDLHDAFDGEDTNVILGVSENGFHVVQKGRQISKFSWSNVNKVYFKSKRFYLDIRVVTEVEYEDLTIGFRCRSRTELKRLYRSAVDHHTFFRRDAAVMGSQRVSFFKLGSRFRYSGRKTFQQLKTSTKSRVPPAFERASSLRISNAVAKRKSDDAGGKSKSTKSANKEQAGHARGEDSPTQDSGDKTDVDSPCISRDVVIMPIEDESSQDEQAATKHNQLQQEPPVSIRILPPTPCLSPAHEHRRKEDAQENDSSANENEKEIDATENEADKVTSSEEVISNESSVTTETRVTETVSSSDIAATTTIITTTTTEIITIDDSNEEMVIVEEQVKA